MSISALNTLGAFPNIAAPKISSSLNLNLNLNIGNMPMDMTSLSSLGADPFSGNFANLFGNNANALSGLGMGNIPGFGNACNPMGSMFGGMMQMINNQTQMINMMMMLLMAMLQKQMANGFGNLANALGGGGIPGGGGFGGGIPGFGGGGFGGGIPSGGTRGNGGASNINNVQMPTGVSGSGEYAAKIAKSLLGQNSTNDLRKVLPDFRDCGRNHTINCASFVSAVLMKSGRVKGKHQVGVTALKNQLLSQGWKRVPKSQARPGDVWIADRETHVELVVGNGDGRLIGSNNRNPDGSQRITEGRPYGNGGFFLHK